MPGIIPDTEIVYVFAIFGFSFEKSVWEAKPHLNTSYSRFSKKTILTNYYMISISGKRELNPRPSGPEPDALAPALLPDCLY